MIRCVLTDIEGTTTSIAFVHDTLFPYAREVLPGWARAHADEPRVAQQLAEVRALAGADLDLDGVIAALTGWMAEDAKVTPLKALQGMVWVSGYEAGDFQGHVYADAYAGLRRWVSRGLALYCYSSGSVQAQQLLFGHSTHGDLRSLFSGWFDTRVGGKKEVESYRAIQAHIGCEPSGILFLSDVTAELDAAAAAGLHTGWLVRDGTEVVSHHPRLSGFDEVDTLLG